MPSLKATDFNEGDYVQLSEKRKGTVRYVGRVKSIGKVCIGIECDKVTPNGNDGSFNGDRYFKCASGKGTFVLPQRIKNIIKKAKSPKKNKLQPSSNRSRTKSPRPKKNGTSNRSQSTKPSKPRNGRRPVKTPKKNARGGGKKDVKSPKPKLSIPTNGSHKERIDYCITNLKDIKSPYAQRASLMKQFKKFFEEEEKLSDEDVTHALKQFRKPLLSQLKDKKVSPHSAAYNLIVSLSKNKTSQFEPYLPYYVGKLLANLKSKNSKSVTNCDKAIKSIISGPSNNIKLIAVFIQSIKKSKEVVVRKHCYQYMTLVLKQYVPNSKKDNENGENEIEKLPNEVKDLIQQGLKVGAKESDKGANKAVVTAIDTFSLIDEIRGETLSTLLPSKNKSKPDRGRSQSTQGRKKPKKPKKPVRSSSTNTRGRSTKPSKKPVKKPPKKTSRTGGTRSTSKTDSKRNGSGKRNGTKKPPKKTGGSRSGSKPTRGTKTGRGTKPSKRNGSNKTPKDKKDPKKQTGSKKTDKNNKTDSKKNGMKTSKTNEVSDTQETAQVEPKKSKETPTKQTSTDDETPTTNDDNNSDIETPTTDDNNNNDDTNNKDEDNDEDNDNVISHRKRPSHQKSRDNTLSFGGDQGLDFTKQLGLLDDPELDVENDYEDSDVENEYGPDKTKDVESEHDVEDDEIEDEVEDDEEPGDEDMPEPPDDDDAKDLIESFLDLKDPQINWKMIEFLSRDNMTHLLMSYISRMPCGSKIWTQDVKVDYNKIIPNTKPLSSDDEKEIQATKLSYSLMRILSNEHAAETVKAFLLRKCSEITVHSLAVFHPLSKGNVYHGRVVLEILLNHWPKSFMSSLSNQSHIKELLKCALFRNLHQGNLNSFFLDLICYSPTTKIAQIQPVKQVLLDTFSEWKFMEYLLSVACSPKHGDDVATKYATFFIDLVARAASIEEAATLFYGYENLIVDSFIEALIDKKNKRTLWHRIQCGQTLVQFLDICSRPTIINPAQAYADMLGLQPPEPSKNILNGMFDKSLKRLHSYIPQLCNTIINHNDLTPISLAGGTIKKPFGQVRLNCLELLTVSADFAQFKCGKVLQLLKINFWEKILDMAFIHHGNNMFLCHFRRLVHLSMIFRRRFLKHLFVKCKLMERFVDFYKTSKTRSTLHGYILQMLWDIFHHDQREDENENENDQKDEEDENNNNNYGDDDDDDNESTGSFVVHDELDDPPDDDPNLENRSSVEIHDDNDEDDNQENDKQDNDNNDNNNNNKDNDENKDESDEEYTEEDLMLRPNFSKDPQDQWDIVKFFNENNTWQQFAPILQKEIELQTNADTQVPNNGQNNNGNQEQLDKLLSHLLNDNSSQDDQGDDDLSEEDMEDDESEEVEEDDFEDDEE